MIERIVVPLDGSLTAEAILPHVRRVLYRNDSEVILVRAVNPPMMENAILVAEAEIGAAREYVLAQAETLEKQGVRVSHVVRIGSPIGVVLDVVEERKATMIALATHGSTGVKRLLFGSVAEGLLRKSPVPVLLVRPFWSYDLAPRGTEQRPIRNLLLPVDGTAKPLEALAGIVELADLFDARIVLLRVLVNGERRAIEAPEKAEADRQLAELAALIEKKGVETVRLVELGEPVDQILKAVASQGIDLIAMPTHGRTGLSRAVAGSVTEEVLRRATVPILGIRTPEKAAKKPKAGRKVKSGR